MTRITLWLSIAIVGTAFNAAKQHFGMVADWDGWFTGVYWSGIVFIRALVL